MQCHVPSGKLTVRYGKWPLCKRLPEGNLPFLGSPFKRFKGPSRKFAGEKGSDLWAPQHPAIPGSGADYLWPLPGREMRSDKIHSITEYHCN